MPVMSWREILRPTASSKKEKPKTGDTTLVGAGGRGRRVKG